MRFSLKRHTRRINYLIGSGSVMNLAGASIREIRIGSQADDVRAMQGDWMKIGNDLRSAYVAVIGEQQSQPSSEQHESERITR